MASRTRIGRKNRVLSTLYDPPSDVSLSKASCKDPLSQTSNVQVPTPLTQPLQVPAPLSQPQAQPQPQLNSSQATTLTHETILNSNGNHLS